MTAQINRQAPSLNSFTANPATMRITFRSNNGWLNNADHTGAAGLLDRTRAKSADTSVRNSLQTVASEKCRLSLSFKHYSCKAVNIETDEKM